MKERDDQAKALLYPQGTQSRSQNSGNDNYYNNAKSPSSTLNDRDPNFQIRLYIHHILCYFIVTALLHLSKTEEKEREILQSDNSNNINPSINSSSKEIMELCLLIKNMKTTGKR